MAVSAYILIQTEVGKAAQVAEEVDNIEGVVSAEDVTGPYDVIARAEAVFNADPRRYAADTQANTREMRELLATGLPDLDERDPARIRHPESASVFFFNAVPYGELVITDQVLGDDGRPSPREPRQMRFVPPGDNRYAVFPGHLHHGVIGRLWRPEQEERLRVTLAVNWWAERPAAPYLRDSSDAVQVFDLDAAALETLAPGP